MATDGIGAMLAAGSLGAAPAFLPPLGPKALQKPAPQSSLRGRGVGVRAESASESSASGGVQFALASAAALAVSSLPGASRRTRRARARAQKVIMKALTYHAKNDDGLLPQPSDPKFKLAIVSTFVPEQELGGSDKMLNGHRFDTIPLANGVIKAGMSCEIVFYNHEEHDEFFEKIAGFDAILVRANPGQIAAAGGSQQKFDDAIMALQKKGKQVWPSPDVMAKMGAKDALCNIKSFDFGLEDTFGYYSPEDMKRDFPKGIAFQPRVVKQNRGSAGEGIWIIKLKSGDYCKKFGDRAASGDEMLVLMEANDNHEEEHTVDEFIEFCANGRTDKSGEWKSTGKGQYYAGGKEAGGLMVDQRYLPRISEGESRFLCVGTELNRIEQYEYPEGVSGNYKQTIHPADAPQYQQCRQMLEKSVPDIMKALDLDMSQLPLLWAADFMAIDDHPSPYVVGEFNCSCLGIAGFFNARGADLSKAEDPEVGQKLCDLIGARALQVLSTK